MGKGIALEFKKKFPEMFYDYQRKCKNGLLKMGEPYLYKESLPWVLNFPTKFHWKENSDLDNIIEGLIYLTDIHTKWGMTSIAFPPLGCGNGNLSLFSVGPHMVKYLSAFDIPVEIYVGAEQVEFMKGLVHGKL
jgi:O-acetyl-ADP-ribose deacetylase (regulator of RNase III)